METDFPGFFDMAKGGTLFLDEIGTMSFEIQSMLLKSFVAGNLAVSLAWKEKFSSQAACPNMKYSERPLKNICS